MRRSTSTDQGLDQLDKFLEPHLCCKWDDSIRVTCVMKTKASNKANGPGGSSARGRPLRVNTETYLYVLSPNLSCKFVDGWGG